MNFDIKKIKSLMSRIDESYDELENGASTEDNGTQQEPPVTDSEQEDDFIPREWDPKKKGNLVGDGKVFKTFDFLAERYDDSRFDDFFRLTYLAKDYNSLANNVHKAVVSANGGFKVSTTVNDSFYGISKFLLPKQEAAPYVTFFDAIYVFSFLDRNSRNEANKKDYNEEIPWGTLTNNGYGKVEESVGVPYDNMLSLIKEFNGCPILQGYMKEAYHRTKAGYVEYKDENGNKIGGELRSLRNMLKRTLVKYHPSSIRTIDGCSRNIYINEPLNITYIPYLDKIDNNEEDVENIAIKILQDLRILIEGENPYSSRNGNSDYKFWSDWAKKNNISPENDVMTSSGLNSITDEMLNRLRVLIAREGDANTPLEDGEKWNGNIGARERRANVIAPSYDIAEQLGTDMGMLVSQEDVQEMRNHTLGDWLDLQTERAGGPQDIASRLRASGPFTLSAINKMLKKLQDAGFDTEDEDTRKETNAFDFFRAYSLVSKDLSTENKLATACRDAIGCAWVKFENTETAKAMANAVNRGDLIPYMKKLSGDTAKLSLDMLAYKDTPDGLRNFVAIEYQGEQHYRPNATASISIDDLYNASFNQKKNGDAISWPGYWDVITTIINFSLGNYSNRRLDESQEDGIIKTDRKGFLNSCVSALEAAIGGEDGGSLKQIVQDECGYSFDDGYEDTFSDWVRRDRPKDKKKPIKSSISHFANSYYRWWCELDTFIQTANDLSKFEKTNQSLFTIEGGKPVGKCGLFYVCPKNTRVIPVEVIGNAISNPYRASFLSGYLEDVGIKIETINEIYHRTFRINGKNIKLDECFSVADGKKRSLLDAINEIIQ